MAQPEVYYYVISGFQINVLALLETLTQSLGAIFGFQSAKIGMQYILSRGFPMKTSVTNDYKPV